MEMRSEKAEKMGARTPAKHPIVRNSAKTAENVAKTTPHWQDRNRDGQNTDTRSLQG